MGKYLLTTTYIPPIAGMMRQTILQLVMSMGVFGVIIKDGLLKYTPRGETGDAYNRCTVLSQRVLGYVGKVRVGWRKSSFPRGKFYIVWLGEGTGIGGARHKVILPVSAKFLRYQYKGKWVTLKKGSKGIKPMRILEKGYMTALPQVTALMSKTFFRVLQVYKRA